MKPEKFRERHNSEGRVRHRTFTYDRRLEAYTRRRTDPQRLVGRHSVYQTNNHEFESTSASRMPNQKQDTPIFDVGKAATRQESNRAHPFHTTYDANGNLTQDATGKQFLYDAENHQTQVKDAANNPIGEYLYDGEGKRVKKISSTEITVFVYNGGGTLVAEYSTVVAPPATAQVSYLTSDHLGSARVITDQNGKVTTRKDYMAFGDEATSAQRSTNLNYDSSETRKGYTGYEKDTESGLEFAQTRYYNAMHGRFTSVDPLTASANTKNPQTFNRYSYVLNSPYKYTDPLGLISSSTGACGSWCGNGSYVDGSAFRGTDASMGSVMLQQLTTEFENSQALAILSTDDFQARFGDDVKPEERAIVAASLTSMIYGRDSYARQLALYLIHNGVTFDVKPSSQITTSAQVTIRNTDILNLTLKSGLIDERTAAGFFVITFDRAEFSNPDYEASIAANIIHEGTHIVIRAIVLASIARGKPIDVDISRDEEIPVEKTARYLTSKGGKFTRYGNLIGLLTRRGKINRQTIVNSGANAAVEQGKYGITTVQEWLRKASVEW